MSFAVAQVDQKLQRLGSPSSRRAMAGVGSTSIAGEGNSAAILREICSRATRCRRRALQLSDGPGIKVPSRSVISLGSTSGRTASVVEQPQGNLQLAGSLSSSLQGRPFLSKPLRQQKRFGSSRHPGDREMESPWPASCAARTTGNLRLLIPRSGDLLEKATRFPIVVGRVCGSADVSLSRREGDAIS